MVVVSKEGSRVVWMVGAALLAAMAGGAYYASRSHAVKADAQPVAVEDHYAKLLDSEPPAAAPLTAEQSSHDPERPADIDAKQWQQLIDAVRNHPQRDRELMRLVGFTRFKRDVDQWTAMKNLANGLERAQVGQRILDALPVRYANREVTASEALALQSAIYADMIPDEVQRRPVEEAAHLTLMRSLEHDAVMGAKLQAEDSQAADYKDREAVIMKRFKDQLIDQSQMEKELDAARLASYK